MVQIIPRSTWDPSPGTRFSRSIVPGRVIGLVLHWPAMTGNGPRTLDAVASTLRGYQRYHRVTRNWPDIGYLTATDQEGRIWWLAGEVVGAHSANKDGYPEANHERWGNVCLVGPGEQLTPAHVAALRTLRAGLMSGDFSGTAYPRMTQLHGHRDMKGAQTSCPGDVVEEAIRSGTLALGPVETLVPEPVGLSAETIKWVQRTLKSSGFYGGATNGIYDPWLRASVAHYQVSQVWPTLTPDGVWGNITHFHAKWVEILQNTLNGWKTDLPELRVDLDFGDLVSARCWEWQRRNHGGAYPRTAAIDGVPGPVMCAALGINGHP